MRNAEQELLEIRAIMERSTRFLSLSGLSGILMGFYALAAAGLAYYRLYYPHEPFGFYINQPLAGALLLELAIIALITLVISVGTAFLLSLRKSKKQNAKLWTSGSKRFLLAFCIPLLVGGIFAIALIYQGQGIWLAPATLIFYGLALLNASHYTLSDIKLLAYSELIVGCIALFMPGYGLVFWALGFGVLHLIYGIIMYVKYDR